MSINTTHFKDDTPPVLTVQDDYIREATITHISDGDTFRAIVDLGYCVRVEADFRLSGLNTKTLKSEDGKKAFELFQNYTKNCHKTIIQSEMLIKTPNKMKKEKWRRYLATVYFLMSGETVGNTIITYLNSRWLNFNQELLKLGLGTPYDGSGERD